VPVYHLTHHAFGSWTEDHPSGYVQRGRGLQPPSDRLHRARRAAQQQPAVRFTPKQQALILDTAAATLDRAGLRLHAAAVCPTHVHLVFSFTAPACHCVDGSRQKPRQRLRGYGVSGGGYDPAATPIHRVRTCDARRHAEQITRRLKRDAGLAVADAAAIRGRKWFSRGWDLTPVRTPEHLTFLQTDYLPRHETDQAGLYRPGD